MDIAGRQVNNNDAVVIGAGILMLIDSFLPWYGVGFQGFGSVSIKGWSAGFLSWFSILLVLAAAGIAAAKVFAGQVVRAGSQVGPALLLLILSGLATVLLLLRLITQSSYTKFGLFLGILLAAAQAVFSFLSFRTSGEAIPDLSKLTSGGSGSGQGGPPAQGGSQGGYGPPQQQGGQGGYTPPPPPVQGSYPPPPQQQQPPQQQGGFPPPPPPPGYQQPS